MQGKTKDEIDSLKEDIACVQDVGHRTRKKRKMSAVEIEL